MFAIWNSEGSPELFIHLRDDGKRVGWHLLDPWFHFLFFPSSAHFFLSVSLYLIEIKLMLSFGFVFFAPHHDLIFFAVVIAGTYHVQNDHRFIFPFPFSLVWNCLFSSPARRWHDIQLYEIKGIFGLRADF